MYYNHFFFHFSAQVSSHQIPLNTCTLLKILRICDYKHSIYQEAITRIVYSSCILLKAWPLQHIQWETNGIHLVCLSEAVNNRVSKMKYACATIMPPFSLLSLVSTASLSPWRKNLARRRAAASSGLWSCLDRHIFSGRCTSSVNIVTIFAVKQRRALYVFSLDICSVCKYMQCISMSICSPVFRLSTWM